MYSGTFKTVYLNIDTNTSIQKVLKMQNILAMYLNTFYTISLFYNNFEILCCH